MRHIFLMSPVFCCSCCLVTLKRCLLDVTYVLKMVFFWRVCVGWSLLLLVLFQSLLTIYTLAPSTPSYKKGVLCWSAKEKLSLVFLQWITCFILSNAVICCTIEFSEVIGCKPIVEVFKILLQKELQNYLNLLRSEADLRYIEYLCRRAKIALS